MSSETRPPGGCDWLWAKGCLQAMSANVGQSSCSFRRTIISTAGLDRKTAPFRPNFKVIRVALFHHGASVLDLVGPTVIITSEVPITAHC